MRTSPWMLISSSKGCNEALFDLVLYIVRVITDSYTCQEWMTAAKVLRTYTMHLDSKYQVLSSTGYIAFAMHDLSNF